MSESRKKPALGGLGWGGVGLPNQFREGRKMTPEQYKELCDGPWHKYSDDITEDMVTAAREVLEKPLGWHYAHHHLGPEWVFEALNAALALWRPRETPTSAGESQRQ